MNEIRTDLSLINCKSRGPRGAAKVLQVSECLLRLLGGHQHVVVAVPGDDVGADAVARQLGRDGRRQPHRPQARVHPQRDAAEGVRAVKAWAGLVAIQ